MAYLHIDHVDGTHAKGTASDGRVLVTVFGDEGAFNLFANVIEHRWKADFPATLAPGHYEVRATLIQKMSRSKDFLVTGLPAP